MPWTIEKRDNEYCVIDKNGKTVTCHPNIAKAERHRKALRANSNEALEDSNRVMLESAHGPVILGVAMTNRPHLPLRDYPLEVVEKDGKEYVRVPFLKKGIYSHPQGKLVFTSEVFERMLENHRNRIGGFDVSLDLRHDPKLGALAWFGGKFGGSITQEDDMLVGYGVPTSEETLDLVKSGKYAYASVEFHPNYKDKLIQKLSTDEIEEVDENQYEYNLYTEKLSIPQEDKMFEEIKFETEEDGSAVLSPEDVQKVKNLAVELTKLEEQTVALETANVKLEEKVTLLEEQQVEEDDELDLPEAVKLQLEDQTTEIRRLREAALAQQVDLVITRAESYRDQFGRGHSKTLLDITRKAMLGHQIALEGDDDTIKLESRDSGDVAEYYRKSLIKILESIPGQVSFEGSTEGDDDPNLELEERFTEDDFKSFWLDQ